jgi:hypothetical protein
MNNWKTSVIYCVSLICFFFVCIAIDLACGPEADPYDYYTSFFHNNIQSDKDYNSFRFTNQLFLYSDDEPASEADINAAEWAAYLGKNVTATDVAKAMYHLNHQTDSVLYNGYLNEKGNLPDTLAGNTFLKALPNYKSALKYYRFAKEVEKIANIISDDRWDPRPLDTVALRDQGIVAFNEARLEKDKFLQLRYYYQAQRLLHYGRSFAQARSVYDKYVAQIPSFSHVKGWALALKAGEERMLKDTIQAAYLFSKVFAQYPERRVQAYRNYMYMDVKTDQVLVLAANDNEKAAIYAITGFGSPQLNIGPLKQVYKISPASQVVGTLLIREINKLEEYYLTGKLRAGPQMPVYSFDATMRGKRSSQDTALYMQELKDFSRQLAADKKYPEPELGTLSAAYIAWIEGNTDEGSTLLKSLYDVKLNPKLNDQKQIIQLLLSAQNIQKFDQVNEAVLLPSLKWLSQKVKEEHKADSAGQWNYYGAHPFAATERNFYEQILAPSYLRHGDTTMTALALAGTDEAIGFWQSKLHSDNLRTIIRWKNVPPANAYLNFLISQLSNQPVNLYELLGTTYLREHQYTRAVNAFKRAPITALRDTSYYTPADPFIELINDYPKIYTYKRTKGYTKLQFAQAMATLQLQIKTDPTNAASYYYKLGTGLYNTSTYGNAWYMISYSWSATDFGRTLYNYYDADYVKTTNAEEYFMLARKYCKTTEFKARCTFMAAKCRQKQFTMPNYTVPDFNALQKIYLLQLRGNEYFAELKSTYKRTDFYKKAATECTYLKDFIEVK